MRSLAPVTAAILAAPILVLPVAPARAAPESCHVGSYRLDDGTQVDIAPSAADTLRWRRFDGTTGALHPQANDVWVSTRGWGASPDGIRVSFSGCDAVSFAGVAGARINFDVREVSFTSHGTPLAGRLVMPTGTAQVTVVVLLHGSEPDSALEGYALQRMLPAQGLGVFVYDKRGTGRSGGTYTQDFSLLADDAVEAVASARALAGARLGRIGFQAGSEGGWIAPLAAARTRVDFAIVCFGLAVNPLEEDQESVDLQLSEKGYSRADIHRALEVAAAAERVFESDFSAGFAGLDRLRSEYGHAPWYKDLRGDYAHIILAKSDAELRAMAPDFNWHTPWHYDSMAVLRASRTPQLWILGGEDFDAPSRETRRRLDGLIDAGHDYTVAFYPDAEHGMTLFELDASGERISQRYAPGYFDLIRDFALHGRVSGAYGDAQLKAPAHAPR